MIPFPHPAKDDGEDSVEHDKQLLAAIATGDKEALRALYLRHCRLLYSIIHTILVDSHEAQDALQVTFVRVWQQSASFKPERGAPTTWMSFMARNVAIDMLRKRKRHPLVLDEKPGLDTVDECDPGAGLEHKRVNDCMEALTEPQRAALHLAYFKGCSQQEIAQKMGIPHGNVKNHLKRGLLRLRQLYHGHD